MPSLSDSTLAALEEHAEACNDARGALDDALDAADADGLSDDALREVAAALRDWQAAQQAFMDAVAASEVSDPSTASLLLKNATGTDPSNARCGIPGAYVDGTDQPFNLDLSGTRGQALTTAAMDYL
jgi:hypothetical protein